ncbi:MAG: glutathione S-transferase family protein [Cyanobacteria bacterium P01_A01_bin.37]
MLELYQFEMSHYAEKIRLILDYKGLDYQKIDVTPGVGQLDIYQLSGQRQVPVLKDGTNVVADSTAIAFYLDKTYPERPIVPTEPKQRGLCLMMEEWADESIGLNSRKVMLNAFGKNADFRAAVLPPQTPEFLRNLINTVPSEAFDFLGMGVGLGPDAIQLAQKALEQDLESLNLLLLDSPYLLGDSPTLADFAVAGLSMYIKFHGVNYLNIPQGLKGKGVPGLADNPAFARVFEWRDRLYADYRKITATPPPDDSVPMPIQID